MGIILTLQAGYTKSPFKNYFIVERDSDHPVYDGSAGTGLGPLAVSWNGDVLFAEASSDSMLKVKNAATDMTRADTDGDGLFDGWSYTEGEIEHIGELEISGTTENGPNGEYGSVYNDIDFFTEPADADSDQDGVDDGNERTGWFVRIARFASYADFINDPGLYGGTSVSFKETSDPNRADTDDDGLRDGLEFGHTNPRYGDTDQDGLTDYNEDDNIYSDEPLSTDHNGRRDKGETSPTDADTDNDFIPDGWMDTQDDGLIGEDLNGDGGYDAATEPDPVKADTDSDLTTDYIEYLVLKTANPSGEFQDLITDDSDSDGFSDVLDPDSDNDGLLDGEENWEQDAYQISDYITIYIRNGVISSKESDPSDADTDDDQLLDGAEPFPFVNTDKDITNGDSFINVRDTDLNADVSGDDYDQVYTVFRTDAVDMDGDGHLDYVSGTKIAVPPQRTLLTTVNFGTSKLNVYSFHHNSNTLPMTYVPLETDLFQTDAGPSQLYQQVMTMEEQTVFISPDGNYIYLWLSWTNYAVFQRVTEEPGNPTAFTKYSPFTSISPGPDNYIALHQESYDYRIVLSGDTDFDGLSNADENAIGSFNDDRDSDDDGVIDGDEPDYSMDTDSDSKVNVLDPDSDGDGIIDGIEMGKVRGVSSWTTDDGQTIKGTDIPFAGDADPTTRTDPLVKDCDRDGLPDGNVDGNGEDLNCNGKVDTTETDPLDADSDDDGLMDGNEVNGIDIMIVDPFYIHVDHTDPLSWDTDGDHIPDGIELGLWYIRSEDTDLSKGHFVVKESSFLGTKDFILSITDPNSQDTDRDGIPDGWVDSNNNGIFDANEGEDTNLDGDVDPTETNPAMPDSDGDGLLDGLDVKVDDLSSSQSSSWFTYTLQDPEWDYATSEYKVGMVQEIVLVGKESAYQVEDHTFFCKERYASTDVYVWGEGEPSQDHNLWFGEFSTIDDDNAWLVRQSGPTDPLSMDSDGDGLLDGTTRWIQKRHETVLGELELHFGGMDADTEVTRDLSIPAQNMFCDPSVMDTDADGLSDGIEARGWEIHVINGATGEEKFVIPASESHSNPARFDPAGWRWDTRSRDTDGDGLGDYAEFENMSCPTRWDTDMDKPADLYEADGQQSITDMMPPVISKIEADYWTVYEYNLPKELKVRVKYTVQDNNGLARVEVECEGLGALETGYDGETGDIKGDETFTTDVQHTFWSGYKFKVRAYDTAGNGAERPAEVKNIWARALDLLLGELVKLVKWLFNMLFGWLYDLIKTFFNQVIKPVFDVAKDSINKLLTVFKESFTFGSVHLATSAFLITYYTTFASLVILQAIFAFGIVLMVIESLVKGLSGGISSAVGTLTTKIGGYLKTLIISTLLVGFAAGFTISTEGDSDTATAPLKAAVPKNIDLIFGATFGIMDLIAAVAPALLLKEGLLRTLEIPAVGNVLKAFLISGVASLILLFIDEGISEIIEGTMPQLFIKFVFDSILLAILIHVVHPLIGSAKDPLMEATKTILPIFYLISETMSWISIVIVGSHLLWVITDGIQNKLETMG